MPVYPGALEISFVFEINNLAIQPAENRTHEPYTIRGGCGKPHLEVRNLTEILPNPAYGRASSPKEGLVDDIRD